MATDNLAPEESLSLVDILIDRAQSREWLEVEYKAARRSLPNDIWSTVSAFANTAGGWIFLGVDNAGQVEGVENPDVVAQQFVDQLRNKQKISFPVCGTADIAFESVQTSDSDSKSVVVIRVPSAARRDRPVYINNNPYLGTYVRRGSGDFTCTKQEVDRMMREASTESADSSILMGYGIDDLDAGTLRTYRRRYQTLRPESPLNDRDDVEFLEGIGAWGRNRDQKGSAPTLAGLLVFGTQSAILSWRGRHLIDYRFEESANDRWLDRVTWEGNLLGAFESIWPRLSEGLAVPFSLSGPARIDTSPVHTALREALVNLLVHADYAESAASLIVRSPDEYRFRNPGASRVGEAELYGATRSDPRNPAIVRMFRYIGLAEEAGTGIPSIMRAWHSLGLISPEIVSDRYEFTIVLRHAHLLSEEEREWLARLGGEWTEAEQVALVTARNEGSIDNATLRRRASIHPADATKVLVNLRNRGLLAMEGDRRSARYTLDTFAMLAQFPPDFEWADDGVGRLALESEVETPQSPDLRASLDTLRPGLGQFAEQLGQIAQVPRQSRYLPRATMDAIVVDLCGVTPLSRRELAVITCRSEGAIKNSVGRLLKSDLLTPTLADRPTHPLQRYSAAERTA